MMTEQHRYRLFSEIQSALANQGVLVSQEAIRIFFENTGPEQADHYTLLMSYRYAKKNADFAKIAEAQEGTFDFPGVVFSFVDETYCLDCGSDEAAHETGAWNWLTQMLGTPGNLEDVLKMKGQSLDWKWCQILGKENPSIKEAMNFIYQNDLFDDVFSINDFTFTKHHGDLFIFCGYEKFNWVRGIIENYLPDIEKIETNLKLKEDLNVGKAPAIRNKI